MDLNHVMVYTRDVQRALDFYVKGLGFTVIEALPEGGYARLKLPAGPATLALHAVEPGRQADAPGIRLYFEVPALDAFCAELESRGVPVRQKPADMPWGWRHAYLDDPDGHEISLYSAGDSRLRPTTFSR